MRSTRNFFATIATLAFCFSLAFLGAAEPWWQKATGPAYQILVYSYADSDGDGLGDINGITDHLDALSSLNVQALWLSPIHPAASYHGYDVTDYKAVDPKLGTLADLDNLIAEAHKKGIHILLDMVFNHSSSKHPWFQSFLNERTGKYASFYYRKDKAVEYGGTTMGTWYDATSADGSKVTYFSAFWDQMPDLNLTNPAVIDEQKSILKFWLDRGVDGFRFDAAREVFNTGKVAKGSPTLSMTKAYWNNLRDYARAIKDDVIFLGEVSTNSNQDIAAYAGGFDNLFDFPTAKQLTDISPVGKDTNFAVNYEKSLKLYKRTAGFIPSPFLSNHDQDRSMTVSLVKWGTSGVFGWGKETSDAPMTLKAKDAALARARVLAGIYLTLPGLPYIYYGEELGMTGRRYKNDDIARRDAYPWSESASQNATTNWTKKTSMLEDGQNRATPPYDIQDADPASLLNLYRSLAMLRKDYTALQGLSFTVCPWPNANKGSLISYIRGDGKDALLVTVNIGAEGQSFSIPSGQKLEAMLDSGTPAELNASAVTLPQGSFVIWKLEQE